MKTIIMPILMSFALILLPANASDQNSYGEKKRSLSDICMVLTSDGASTYLPKDAVLYAPEHLKSKIGSQLEGTFVSWDEFCRRNSGWIYLHQVSREQASGSDPIKPEAIEAYKGHNKMVIAHNFGNIISVRPSALESSEQ